jgi:hypothetical protein
MFDLNNKVEDLKDVYADHDKKYQDLRQKCLQAEQKTSAISVIGQSWQSKVMRLQNGLAAYDMAQVYEKIANTLRQADEKSSSVYKEYTVANDNLETLLQNSQDLKSKNEQLLTDTEAQIDSNYKAEANYQNLSRQYNELEKRSKNLTKNIEKIDAWINRTLANDLTLTNLKADLDNQQADLAKNEEKANDIIRKIQSLESLKSSLPKPEAINNDNSNLQSGEQLLSSIEASIDDLKNTGPKINSSLQTLLQDSNLNSELEKIRNDIYDLKLLIASTRDIVNEIKVAVNFTDSTMVQLKPSADFQPSLVTSGSLYLQTREQYAPIALIYNDSTPNEYLSLYLQQGRPHLQYRLSDSEGPLIVSTNVPINDGQWHKLEIDRVGKLAKLRVYSENGQNVNEAVKKSNDNSVIFNLDPNGAKFILGQFPLKNLPQDLKTIAAFNNQFRGAIDDVKLNGHSFGLWNYDNAVNIKGEPKRTTSLEQQKPDPANENAVYFAEDSFMCLSNSGIKINKRTPLDVTISFKTDSPNGLIWIWSNDDKQYIAIYLESGHLNVAVSQSNDFKKYLFEKQEYPANLVKLNDNLFHTVHVRVSLVELPLAKQTLNNVQTLQILAEEIINQDEIQVIGQIEHDCSRKIIVRQGQQCIGGIPATLKEGSFKDLQFSSFIGCMNKFLVPSFELTQINLQETLLRTDTKSSNVAPKCPDVADQCSFRKSNTPAFIEFNLDGYFNDNSNEPDASEQEETIGVSFVTTNPDGVLFYRSINQNDHTNRLLLKLQDRHLHLIEMNRDNVYRLKSDGAKQFSDNQLHVAFVIVKRRSIALRVDDHVVAEFERDDASATGSRSSSNLYVGGVPEAQRGSVPNEPFTNFEGCITQVVHNNNELKFANANSRSANLAFSKCYKTPIRSAFANLPAFRQLQNVVNLNKLINIKQQQLLKNDECTLNKQYDTSQLKSVGLRFGLSKRSRLEVQDTFPIKITTFVSFKFRTLQQDGLMFYASDAQFADYIAVWLHDGYVNYAFDCGTGFMHIKSKRTYSDGRYHTVTIKRDKQQGALILADRTNTSIVESIEDKSSGTANSLSVVEPYYFGNIPESDKLQLPALQTDLIITDPFIGCMSDFNIAHKVLRNKIQKIDLMNCSNNHESGIFFTGHSLTSHASLPNYLSLKDAFEIAFEMKSRTKNGLILYYGTRDIDSKDYVALELVEGDLVFKVNVAGIENSVKFMPENAKNELCNSSWIRIKLKKSEKGVLALELKGNEITSSFYQEVIISNTMANTLYMGALPSRGGYADITQTNEPFIGCIRDLSIKKNNGNINKVLLDMNLEPSVLNYCPLK